LSAKSWSGGLARVMSRLVKRLMFKLPFRFRVGSHLELLLQLEEGRQGKGEEKKRCFKWHPRPSKGGKRAHGDNSTAYATDRNDTHTRKHTHIYTRARAHTHTRTHARARAHTHTHTHTHTQIKEI
jgi:hypothetical protein